MLLAEYMKLAHAMADDRQVAVDLNQVTEFVLGEHYLIRMRSGKTVDVRDFTDILDIMRDEFSLWKEQFVPKVVLKDVTGKNKTITGIGRHLQVTAMPKSDFLPAIPPDRAIDRIRLAVTMYNLTGDWDQFNRSNL